MLRREFKMLFHLNAKLVNASVRQTLRRQFSTKFRTYEEVRIPVPWGHIAGKWWGPQNKRPILATHGWQDNCGSFDTLIPYLPPHIPVLAIDTPGHGLSSFYPPGMVYHSTDYAIVVRRIVQYFNWDKVSLMGHSLGAIFHFIYAVLYPETIDFMINFDALKPLVFEEKKFERMTKIVDNLLKYEKIYESGSEPPAYDFDVLERMLHEGSRKSIDLKNCKYILERNVTPSKNEPHKFCISRDLRVKLPFLLGMAQKDIVESTYRLTFPFLLYKSKSGPFVEKKQHALEVLDVLEKVNPDFRYENVEGTHHVHLNQPELVAKLIVPFIEKYDVHDRSRGGFKEEIRTQLKGSANIPM